MLVILRHSLRFFVWIWLATLLQLVLFSDSHARYPILSDVEEDGPADSVGEPASEDEFSGEESEPEPEDEESSQPGSDAESDIPESESSEPEDDDEEPEDLPPPPKGKAGTFVLPVRTASKARANEDAESMVSGSSLGAGLNLDSLSSGLKIKQPPKLIAKPEDAPPPPAPPARVVPPPRGSATGGPSTAAAGTRTDTNRGSLHAALSAAAGNPATASGTAGTLTAQQAADLASVSSIGLTSAASVASMGTTTQSVAHSTALPSDLVLRDPAEVKVEALANVSLTFFVYVFKIVSLLVIHFL